MGLLQEWRDDAYSKDMNKNEGKLFWADYFNKEKEIYEKILATPETVEKGTVKELADKFGITVHEMAGFLDGINDSLKIANPIEEMDENTVVSLCYDLEKLYYNMCEAQAEWLYGLPVWNNLLTEERRKELFLQQRKSGTIVKEKKIGRNDKCPCGSGKKYKFCCGR